MGARATNLKLWKVKARLKSKLSFSFTFQMRKVRKVFIISAHLAASSWQFWISVQLLREQQLFCASSHSKCSTLITLYLVLQMQCNGQYTWLDSVCKSSDSALVCTTASALSPAQSLTKHSFAKSQAEYVQRVMLQAGQCWDQALHKVQLHLFLKVRWCHLFARCHTCSGSRRSILCIFFYPNRFRANLAFPIRVSCNFAYQLFCGRSAFNFFPQIIWKRLQEINTEDRK